MSEMTFGWHSPAIEASDVTARDARPGIALGIMVALCLAAPIWIGVAFAVRALIG